LRLLGTGLVAALVIAIAVGALLWRPRTTSSRGVQEFRLPVDDIPAGIAVARDGTVWFTLEGSSALGLLRNGEVQKLSKGADSV